MQRQQKRPGEIGSTRNIGRYSFPTSPDPNRQMPTPGEPFNEKSFKDHVGREIEKENRLLLQLISLFRPDRIANIHGSRDLRYAGIFANPRPTAGAMRWVLKQTAVLPLKWPH